MENNPNIRPRRETPNSWLGPGPRARRVRKVRRAQESFLFLFVSFCRCVLRATGRDPPFRVAFGRVTLTKHCAWRSKHASDQAQSLWLSYLTARTPTAELFGEVKKGHATEKTPCARCAAPLTTTESTQIPTNRNHKIGGK
jgi:hypothetical protein